MIINFLNKISIFFIVYIIRVYQIFFSPILKFNCRYLPTCSNYALEAIYKHGVLKGGLLTLKRISSCHPWGKSGHDPVPE